MNPDNIPAYRGVMSAFLGGGQFGGYWLLGKSPRVPTLGIEAQSLPSDVSLSITDPTSGYIDANPSEVIKEILTGSYGKLGIDPSLIDNNSFSDAAVTLLNEKNGYSRSVDSAQDAAQIITEILVQIDGTIFTDPASGKIKIKLVRPDFDPNTIPEINQFNCKDLENLTLGGWSDIVNRVRLKWTNRSKGYVDDSAVAMSGSNSFISGQQEVVIQMPGVHRADLADQLAARELAARSRPIARCTAVVDRTFHLVNPGDAVAVRWPKANIAGMVFRVGAVNRGSRKNSMIRLDLIQDYHYVWRDLRPAQPWVDSFGSPGGLR
jgi:hypothetical protein